MLVSQGLKTYIVCSPISLYGRKPDGGMNMTKREDCDCELCENTRAFYDTTSPDFHWTYCPIWERRNKEE